MKRISLFCLVIVTFLLVGCNKETKEVKTLDNFKDVATSYEYTIDNNINNYSGIDYITGSYLAIKGDSTIEMAIYDNEKSAKKAYKTIIKKFKELKASGATADITKGGNYQTFKMISNGYYMTASRIDNTLIFSRSKLETRDSVDNVFKDMGY